MTYMNNIEARLDDLTSQILIPLRSTRYVDRRAMDKLNELIDELSAELSGKTEISRRLAGKLWFIFTQMLAEADHARLPDQILDIAWEYADGLERIFISDLPSSPPNPR